MKMALYYLLFSAFVFSCSLITKAKGKNARENDSSSEVVSITGYKKICEGEGLFLCWNRFKPNEDLPIQTWLANIEGFSFQWGNDYQLSVRVEVIENPQQDGSNFTYALDKINSKKPVKSNTDFDFVLRQRHNREILSNYLKKSSSGWLFDTKEFICFDKTACDNLVEILSTDVNCDTHFYFQFQSNP